RKSTVAHHCTWVWVVISKLKSQIRDSLGHTLNVHLLIVCEPVVLVKEKEDKHFSMGMFSNFDTILLTYVFIHLHDFFNTSGLNKRGGDSFLHSKNNALTCLDTNG
ncbi:hypothetical protein EGW08_008166, partial [Elysia chlorotica]